MAPTTEDAVDAALARWREMFPTERPFDRYAKWPEDRFCLFHSLPGSKQHADEADEYSEVLFRQLTLLTELIGDDPDQGLLVITRSWSSSSAPVLRKPRLHRMLPASHLRSDLTDLADPTDEDDEDSWEHLWVSYISPRDPGLVSLLPLIAGYRVTEVDVAPIDLAWLFQPYDGGVHLYARTSAQAEQLTLTHRSWLPGPSDMEMASSDDAPSWQIRFQDLSKAEAKRLLALFDEQDLFPTGAHLVDPQSELSFELGRESAQALRAALSADGGDVFEPHLLRTSRWTPSKAREYLGIMTPIDDELDDFVDNYGYRYPGEAVDGVLDRKFWDPDEDYDGIRGSKDE
jgi:hypothetical protein